MNNVLIKSTKKKFIEFTIKVKDIHSVNQKEKIKKFKFPTFGYIIKIADFDFSCIKDCVNNMKCD